MTLVSATLCSRWNGTPCAGRWKLTSQLWCFVTFWAHWCHGAPPRVMLPFGGALHVDCGAEQGDPLGPWGPLYCVLVLIRVLPHIWVVFAERGTGFFDLWYLAFFWLSQGPPQPFPPRAVFFCSSLIGRPRYAFEPQVPPPWPLSPPPKPRANSSHAGRVAAGQAHMNATPMCP